MAEPLLLRRVAFDAERGHGRTELQSKATKGEVELDQYEVRGWDDWYRHMTLSGR